MSLNLTYNIGYQVQRLAFIDFRILILNIRFFLINFAGYINHKYTLNVDFYFYTIWHFGNVTTFSLVNNTYKVLLRTICFSETNFEIYYQSKSRVLNYKTNFFDYFYVISQVNNLHFYIIIVVYVVK